MSLGLFMQQKIHMHMVAEGQEFKRGYAKSLKEKKERKELLEEHFH